MIRQTDDFPELEHFPDRTFHRLPRLLADDPEHLANRPARCLRLRPAGELLGHPIQARDASLDVRGDDGVAGALQRDGEALTFDGERLLHPPPVEALEHLPASIALDERELVVS